MSNFFDHKGHERPFSVSLPRNIAKIGQTLHFFVNKTHFTIENRKKERNSENYQICCFYEQPKGFLENLPSFHVENESVDYAHFEFPVTESASLPAEKTGADSLHFLSLLLSHRNLGTLSASTSWIYTNP
jgi:hypothetical protein